MEQKEIIILQKFQSPIDDLIIRLPTSTMYLKKLSLKELKIGINAADVGANMDYITLEFINPRTNMFTCNGGSIVTVPNLEAAGTHLYRHYQIDYLELLENQSTKTTERDFPLTIRIRKGDETILSKNYVYLRLNAEYEKGSIWNLNSDRFNYQ